MMPSRIVLSRRRRVGRRCAAMVTSALVLASLSVHAEERSPGTAEPGPIETGRPDDPAVTLAFVTGAAMAGASLGLGGAVAVGSDTDDAKATGIYAAQLGLALSPFVSHAMLGEWKRGVLYSIPTVAGALGMMSLLQARPHTVAGGPAAYQYGFTTLMALSVFSAMVGVSDVLSFHDRAGMSSVTLLPDLTQERIGIRIGGKL